MADQSHILELELSVNNGSHTLTAVTSHLPPHLAMSSAGTRLGQRISIGHTYDIVEMP